MTNRLLFAIVGSLVVASAVSWGVSAQTSRQSSVSIADGQLRVEEVRVGESCAVVVWSVGPGPRQLAAVPCSR